mmetsp:Transcript_3381/g.7090  ORF Transcript_3381/g.7090 Transcript_3381/m.7090 type:complete len:306 (-) Transcript_3381:8-925(-)
MRVNCVKRKRFSNFITSIIRSRHCISHSILTPSPPSITAKTNENTTTSLKCLPIIPMIILRQQPINITRLKPPDISHVQIDQLRLDVIVHRIDELHLRQHRIPHESVIHHGRRTNEIVERVLPFVGVHGTEFEHSRDGDDGYGVLFGGEGNHVGTAGGYESSVRQNGMSRQQNLINSGHDGECGRIVNDRRIDPRLGQFLGHGMSSEMRGSLADDDLEFPLFGGCRFQEQPHGLGKSICQNNLPRMNVLRRLLVNILMQILQLAHHLLYRLHDALTQIVPPLVIMRREVDRAGIASRRENISSPA